MSTVVMARCWPLLMPPTAKAVLISLADNANDHGVCWPSQPKIAARVCLSERAVRNAIKWLEEAGYLVADRSNGRHTSYTVVAPTPAPDATPERGAGAERRAGEPRHHVPEPRHQVPPNRKEPSRTVTTEKKRASAPVCPAEISDGVWEDWIALRKAKRAPTSETALSGIRREAELAGVTLESAMRTCCERGWIGFKAEWITSRPVIEQGRESAAGRAARLAREGDERDARRDREGSRANHRPVIEGPRLELSP